MIDVYVYFQGDIKIDESLYSTFCDVKNKLGYKCSGTIKIIDVMPDGTVYPKETWSIAKKHSDIQSWNLLVNGKLGNCDDEKTLTKCVNECVNAVFQWRTSGYRGKVMIDVEPTEDLYVKTVASFLSKILTKLGTSEIQVGAYVSGHVISLLNTKPNASLWSNLITALNLSSNELDLPCYSDCGDSTQLAGIITNLGKLNIKVNPIIGISGNESRGLKKTTELLTRLQSVKDNIDRLVLFQVGFGVVIDDKVLNAIKGYCNDVHYHDRCSSYQSSKPNPFS